MFNYLTYLFVIMKFIQRYSEKTRITSPSRVRIVNFYNTDVFGGRATIDELVKKAPIDISAEENIFDLIAQENMCSSGLRGILVIPQEGRRIFRAVTGREATIDIDCLSRNERTSYKLWDYHLDGQHYIISVSLERFSAEMDLINRLTTYR